MNRLPARSLFAHRQLARLLVRVGLLLCVACQAHGDLAAPGWYGEAGVVEGWHYRVPVELPAGTGIGSTVVLDVDFTPLLVQLGVAAASVDFDEAAVRIVRPGGTLAVAQEFLDNRFGGVIDASGNARGEIRFIAEEAGPDYLLYFDVSENGVKPPAPGVTPINGHFELSAGVTPTGWVVSAVNAGGAQNNEVHRTGPGSTINLPAGCANNAANGLDTSPNTSGGSVTGQAWHLLGYRDNCEDGGGGERIRLSRDIEVPAGAAAGTLVFYFQVQSFDGISNNNNYDWFSFYVNGATVNHNALNIDNSGAPALRIDNNRLGRNGYGNNVSDFGWKRAELSLAAWAGSTINFRIESRHSASDNSYRAFLKIDDVEWSRQNAALGSAEGFGANLIAPADTAADPPSTYAAGQTLTLAVRLDAMPSGVTADVLDSLGNPVVQGIVLFDDASHGDLVAGDSVWTNDGSVAAEPTYTFQPADVPDPGWLVRAFAPDFTSAGSSSADGLLLIDGQPANPAIQANYFNIDEQTFILGGARMVLGKTVATLLDPTGGLQPKSVPGARLAYSVRVVNEGPDAADNDSVVLLDAIPAELSLCVLPVCTCVGACAPVDPVAYDETASPILTGLTFDYATQVSYSLDGTDFSYVPAPDGAGFDPAVRFVRVAPLGAMAAPAAAGDPEFTLRYVVRLE